jgi:hypothetical protein
MILPHFFWGGQQVKRAKNGLQLGKEFWRAKRGALMF